MNERRYKKREAGYLSIVFRYGICWVEGESTRSLLVVSTHGGHCSLGERDRVPRGMSVI